MLRRSKELQATEAMKMVGAKVFSLVGGFRNHPAFEREQDKIALSILKAPGPSNKLSEFVNLRSKVAKLRLYETCSEHTCQCERCHDATQRD